MDITKYCLNLEDNVSAVYDCFAVSNHIGKMGFGHYTAFARNIDDNGSSSGWELFNDSKVSKVTPAQVITSDAYILFYKRRRMNGTSKM